MRNLFAADDRAIGIWPALFCLWATLAICSAIALSGFSSESITRLLVIVFLLGQIALRSRIVNGFFWLSPKLRFIALGTVLAAVVEGFHMISMPVFPSLRIDWNISFIQGLIRYGLDLLFTVPAYVIIFSIIWYFIQKTQYALWQYIVIMGLAQALGDGGLFFFLGAPSMLLFLPYPMTNYHAINVIPFLSVRDHLRHEPSSSAFAYLAIPGLVGTYFICGAIIRLLGRACGLE
ncbi:MAG: hypothetical protein U1F68_17240 [Gammaproteobacteria bacterium]